MSEQEGLTETPAVEYSEPMPTVEADVVVEVVPPARRLVKLANQTTMYLLEDGIRYPVVTSGAAAALGIKPEVVEDLSEWPEGEPYRGA